MGNSYFVVDSGPTFAYASQAYELMKKLHDIPVSYVVNTHVHDDHWLGNSFYKQQNAIIIGPKSFAHLPKLEQTRMQRRIMSEAYKATTQEFPTVLVEDEKTIWMDRNKVVIRSVNTKAHTEDDLYVYIPHKRVVFAGDLVFNERIPSLRDGNIIGWLESLHIIMQLDVDYIIGGHGKMVSKDSVKFTYDYLKTLRDEVLKKLDEGEEIGDVVNNVKMLEYKGVPFYDSIHRQNVETAYRTLEWEDE